MMYFYTPSFASLVFASQNFKIKNFVILSHNKKIIEFCEKGGIQCIEVPHTTSTNRKVLLEFKNNLVNFAKKFEEIQVTFCHYGFDYWGLFLMYEFRKKNTVYFELVDIQHSQSEFTISKNYLRKKLDSKILQAITGLNLKVFSIQSNRFFIGLNIRQLNTDFKTLTKTKISSVFKENKIEILKNFQIESPQILFIDQGDSSFTVPDELITLITENCISKIHYKEHPSFDISNALISKKMVQLPKEVPIEFIGNDDTLFIGIISSSMRNQVKRISLVHLVDWYEEEAKMSYLKNFNFKEEESPKSYEQLVEIIKSHQ